MIIYLIKQSNFFIKYKHEKLSVQHRSFSKFNLGIIIWLRVLLLSYVIYLLSKKAFSIWIVISTKTGPSEDPKIIYAFRAIRYYFQPFMSLSASLTIVYMFYYQAQFSQGVNILPQQQNFRSTAFTNSIPFFQSSETKQTYSSG